MGTTRNNRALPAVQPGWLRVDPRTPRQLLAATVPTAALFTFYDETCKPRGRWDAFFAPVPMVRYARLAELDGVERARFFRAALKKLPRHFDPADPSEFAAAWGVIDRLFQLFLHIDTEARFFAGLPAESAYAASLEQAITGVLRDKYQTVGRCGRWLARKKKIAPFGLTLTDGQESRFELAGLHPAWWQGPAASATPDEALSADAFVALLTEAAWATHATLQQLCDAAAAGFAQRYAAPSNLPPHFALYLAFVRQFTAAQEAMNRIPTRHRDYYYREVLGLNPAPAVPDRAWVSFQAAPGRRVDLPEGIGLLAGKDLTGQPVIYRTTAPALVTPSTLARVATTWLADPVDPRSAGFYVATDAASADGAGAPLPPGAGWAPFGEDQSLKPPGTRTMTDAWTGFAVSSPVLHLEGGTRNIGLVVEFVRREEPAQMGKKLWLTGLPWTIEYSGALAWVPAAPELCTCTLRCGRNASNEPVPLKMIVVVRLPAGAPACVNYNPKVLGEGFDDRTPVVRVRYAKPLRAFRGCDAAVGNDVAAAFAAAKVRSAVVTVSVRGIRDLALVGPTGKLPAGQPVPLFGSPPQPAARFAIGKTELFRKHLDSLRVAVTWQGLPTDAGTYPRGLPDYYADYLAAVTNPAPEMFRNDQYRVGFSVLARGRWVALPPGDGPLFGWANDPTEIEAGPLAATNEWSWKDLPPGLLPVDPSLGGPLELGPASALGFIGLTLKAPDYLFGNALFPAVVTTRALENAAVVMRTTQHAGRSSSGAGSLDPPSAFNLLKTPASWWRRVWKDALKKGPGWEIKPAVFDLLEAHWGSFPAAAAAGRSQDEVLADLRQLKHEVFFDKAGLQALVTAKLRLSKTPAGRANRDEVVFWLASLLAGTPQQPRPANPDQAGIQAVPPPPLVPTISEVTISYTATAEIPVADQEAGESAWNRLWQLAPLAPRPLPVKGKELLPVVPVGGTLYLAFRDVAPPETISLLFVLADTPASSEAVDDNEPRWSCLVGDEWRGALASAVHDGTAGFRRSGIVRIDLPVYVDATHSILPDKLVWLRVQTMSPSPLLRVVRLLPHAAEVAWAPPAGLAPDAMAAHFAQPLAVGAITGLQVPGPAIQKVEQPLPGFGGVRPESDSDFVTRVSERLRHKGRAVAARDYEQLILQRFPGVFSARVVRPQDAAQAGSVTIIVLPRVANPPVVVPPGFTAGELFEIEEALKAVMPLSAKIVVRNPGYESLTVKAQVRFAPDRSFEFYRARLAAALNAFISPWIYRQESVVEPVTSFHASDLGAFVRRQPYVLEAGSVAVFRQDLPLETVAPTSALTMLLAAPEHLVTPLAP